MNSPLFTIFQWSLLVYILYHHIELIVFYYISHLRLDKNAKAVSEITDEIAEIAPANQKADWRKLTEIANEARTYIRAGKRKNVSHLIKNAQETYKSLEGKVKNVKVQKLLQLLIELIEMLDIIDQSGSLSSNVHYADMYYYHIKKHLLKEIKAEFLAQKSKL